MNKLVLLIISVAIWYAFENKDLIKNEYLVQKDSYVNSNIVNFQNESSSSNNNFTCDGREYCSEMTSCEEATYFINHCPNTKMDGDGDGVPCERQWCN